MESPHATSNQLAASVGTALQVMKPILHKLLQKGKFRSAAHPIEMPGGNLHGPTQEQSTDLSCVDECHADL